MTSPMAPITRPTTSGVVPVAVTSSGPVTAASTPRAVNSSRNRSASGVRTITADDEAAVSSASGELAMTGPGRRSRCGRRSGRLRRSGWRRGPSPRRPGAQEAAASGRLGVEAVGGLVEDRDRRLAEEGGGQAEPLAHAEPDADTSRRARSAGLGQRVVGSPGRQPGGRREDAEVIDGPAARVEADAFNTAPTWRAGSSSSRTGAADVAAPALGATRPSSMRSVVVLAGTVRSRGSR